MKRAIRMQEANQILRSGNPVILVYSGVELKVQQKWSSVEQAILYLMDGSAPDKILSLS